MDEDFGIGGLVEEEFKREKDKKQVRMIISSLFYQLHMHTAMNNSIFRLLVALPARHSLTTLMRSNFGHDGRCWPKNLPALASDFE